MFERADAFVALPGGIGTLEELVEQMTWAQLGRHKKPILSPTSTASGTHSRPLAHMRALALVPSPAQGVICSSPAASRTFCRSCAKQRVRSSPRRRRWRCPPTGCDVLRAGPLTLRESFGVMVGRISLSITSLQRAPNTTTGTECTQVARKVMPESHWHVSQLNLDRLVRAAAALEQPPEPRLQYGRMAQVFSSARKSQDRPSENGHDPGNLSLQVLRPSSVSTRSDRSGAPVPDRRACWPLT